MFTPRQLRPSKGATHTATRTRRLDALGAGAISTAALLFVGCESSELIAIVDQRPLVAMPVDAGEPQAPTAPTVLDAGPLIDAGPPQSTTTLDAAPPDVVDAASSPNDAGLGAAQPVTALNDPVARDTDVTVTEDLLELYFMSTREGSKDIFRSLRSDPWGPWGSPELVVELSHGGQDENPFVANDGLEIWFFTDRDRALGSIWHSTRESREQPWTEPTPVSGLTIGEGASDVAVAVSADRTRYVLSSKAAGAVPYNLYESVRDPADATLSVPTLLAEVSSVYDDFDPDFAEAGRFIAFDSIDTGDTETRRLFWARRESVDSPFSAPVPLMGVPDGIDLGAVALSEDATRIWFSAGVAGSADIYELVLDQAPQ